jgi:Transposase DDE domain group 1
MGVTTPSVSGFQEGTFQMRVSRSLDTIAVMFDDDNLVANAGLILPATLARNLELEELINSKVRLPDSSAGCLPGRKALTLVHSMIAGGDCIDDADVLRAGSSAAVLGHVVMAPSTLGTFLRGHTFGNVRQLDSVNTEALRRAWAAGAGPDPTRPLVVDIDSTICQVFGHRKQGAAFGYTKVRGYHPLLAFRADFGEVLATRMRKGSANTSRGIKRFLQELRGNVAHAGWTGQVVLRCDSGFWSKQVIEFCEKNGWEYSITVRQNPNIRARIDTIAPTGDSCRWRPMPDYPDTGYCEIAECDYDDTNPTRRLIVRRVMLTNSHNQPLFPNWSHHAFVTNRTGYLRDEDQHHRDHAVVELAIRDLKDNGLAHCPSGRFNANAAWLSLAALAHNLTRWTITIGTNQTKFITGATTRRKLFSTPGRMAHSARRYTLHLPTHWPWAETFTSILNQLRTVQLTT